MSTKIYGRYFSVFAHENVAKRQKILIYRRNEFQRVTGLGNLNAFRSERDEH